MPILSSRGPLPERGMDDLGIGGRSGVPLKSSQEGTSIDGQTTEPSRRQFDRFIVTGGKRDELADEGIWFHGMKEMSFTRNFHEWIQGGILNDG